MADKNGESYDALVPIVLVGAAAGAAALYFGRTQGGGGGDLLSWNIDGAPGNIAPKTGTLNVKVQSVHLPYDRLEIWAVGANSPAMPTGSEHMWGSGTAPGNIAIPLAADYSQFGYLFVWLVLRQGGVMVASGNPHDGGYDNRLMKLLRLT